MTLTLSGGPLSGRPPKATNYEIDGPKHRLFLDPFPRRVRGVLGGEVVVDTTRGALLHETGHLPVLYVPEDDVRSELTRPSEARTHCPFKGEASYLSVAAGDRVASNAIWAYREPLEAASWLRGLLAFDWEALDAWFEEDERVEGHLRDPYHRVDVRDSSRHVRILAGDETIAETRQPKLLFETGLPTRYYLPPGAVRGDLLEPSDTHTICPYKGTASYGTLRRDGSRLEDAAWFYPEPLESALKARDHICFSHPELAIEVDGELVE